MNENEEIAYMQGNKQAYANMLQICLNHLGEPHSDQMAWEIERQEAISSLRDLCKEFGDNDWPDSLYLADIINKHLANHLWSKR